MGRALSLYAVAAMARYVVPTFADAVTGRITRARVDNRCVAFARTMVARARMNIEVRGLEHVPAGRAFVYMSNHQSHMDIPVLYSTVPARTLRMVGKTELFKVPLWGRAMRASDFIEVDRSNRDKSIASLDRATALIASGVSIWIAPEGTRSPDGRLGRLKKGGFHIARNTGTPIVPIAISGTTRVLPKGGTSMAYDVPVRVVFGAPIPVADRTIDELLEDVSGFLHENVST